MTRLRQTGDERDEAQRWNCDQARIQTAALNGELGAQAQLIAMSAAYGELMATQQFEAAAALKARAIQIAGAS